MGYNRSLNPLTGIERTLELIESGSYKTMHEATIRSHVKKYLIHTKGHQCAICDTKEWRGDLVPLVCDHIDGDIKNVELSNFRNVCANCDAQLPTFKSKNKKGGRDYDKQYMSENSRVERRS